MPGSSREPPTFGRQLLRERSFTNDRGQTPAEPIRPGFATALSSEALKECFANDSGLAEFYPALCAAAAARAFPAFFLSRLRTRAVLPWMRVTFGRLMTRLFFLLRTRVFLIDRWDMQTPPQTVSMAPLPAVFQPTNRESTLHQAALPVKTRLIEKEVDAVSRREEGSGPDEAGEAA